MQLEPHYVFQNETQEETKNVQVDILGFHSCKLLVYYDTTSDFIPFFLLLCTSYCSFEECSSLPFFFLNHYHWPDILVDSGFI